MQVVDCDALFGGDFAGRGSTTPRLDSDVRIPCWLALIELHADGYRYGIESNKHLPYVFEKMVDILTRRRVAWREQREGVAKHALAVPEDLARALSANPVSRNNIAIHDLLSYALKTPASHLGEIASEQLQHGGTLASSSLMPTTSADVIAIAFFDFVMKHDLAEALASMSSEQIQMIAVFLSNLQQKPPKRVDISD